MKIDVHVHTKKYKQGDAETREVTPERFCDIVLSTDVKILCITNHNAFDFSQFKNIEAALQNEVQIWPGIELDVVNGEDRGHLLVIVSPKYVSEFNSLVEKITSKTTPDTFTITIDEVIDSFDDFEPLYIAHYKQKKPNISEESLEKLVERTKNPCRVIKEVTNAISAGIYISHGHPSIYGSDVQNWDKYVKLSHRLPDLRLPVESFEHFCLLLEKDQITINTLLDRKTPEVLNLTPFEDNSEIKLKTYNDINVVFGSKGTGKSCILRAVSKYYSDRGIESNVFTPASDRLDEIYDTKGKDITINLEPYGINYCTDEISEIRNATEVDVTSLRNYVAFFEAKKSNRAAKKILLKEIEPEQTSAIQRKFEGYKNAAYEVEKFLEFLKENNVVKQEIGSDDLENVTEILSALIAKLDQGVWNSFSGWKELGLLNSAIDLLRLEVEKKTGTPSKPITAGFHDYALNRIQVELNSREIIQNFNKVIDKKTSHVGNLGSEKGQLMFETEIIIQNASITDSSLSSIKGAKKGDQKKFCKAIQKIYENVYNENLFESIAELNELDDIDDIKTINELIMFKRYFSVDGKKYEPSSGEASMLMLQKELEKDKDVYILDEPERSLGNDYISDVIVPLLKEKARSGKRIFISTHDANIAVRTLPYSSIYRCHGSDGYDTYVGNPFSNNLKNISDETSLLDWKKISMKTLEGGEEAFGERGKIYGSN